MHWFAAVLLMGVLPGMAVASELTCAEPPLDDTQLGGLMQTVAPVLERFPSLDPARNGLSDLCTTSNLTGELGFYDVEANRIVLEADLSPGLKQAVFIHEIRHLQQRNLGFCPSRDLAMRDYALAVFAMEADASVTSLTVAWAFRQHGDPAIWNALSDWPMQSDIAEAFETAMDTGGTIAIAASEAFNQWFARPDRRDAYYVATCMDYLDALEEEGHLPRYESLNPGFFADLCTLPDGQPYDCAAPDTDGS